jgi:hypothetical protein
MQDREFQERLAIEEIALIHDNFEFLNDTLDILISPINRLKLKVENSVCRVEYQQGFTENSRFIIIGVNSGLNNTEEMLMDHCKQIARKLILPENIEVLNFFKLDAKNCLSLNEMHLERLLRVLEELPPLESIEFCLENA